MNEKNKTAVNEEIDANDSHISPSLFLYLTLL